MTLLVSLIGAGFSAQAGLTRLADGPDRATAAGPRPTGYEAQDHFPGSALFQLEDDWGSGGATGTAPLPDIPVPENAAPADPSLQAAAPFQFRGSALDRARAVECLTAAVYYEAAIEPDEGQRAVAQTVLNRVRHPAFPSTVCGVVYQGSEKPVCQFSFACDGAMTRPVAQSAWDRARKVADAAISGSVFAPVGMATHYHTFAVRPGWNRSLVMTGVFGAHFFHRWKGWWGTAAAFRQTYAGHEPQPGPHRRAEAPAAAEPVRLAQAETAAPAPAAAAPAPAPAARPRAVRPSPASGQPVRADYGDSGTPRPAYGGDSYDPETGILDRWKDAGKPLR